MTDPVQEASAAVVEAATAHQEAVEVAREAQTTAIVAKAIENIVPMADLVMIREYIVDAVAVSVKLNVNGKIDAMRTEIANHNAKHEEDMVRILPIIEAFETSERAVNTAKASGKVVLWVAGFISAVGGAFLIIKQIFQF
jgi:hypothetical protein